jgi:uncharacterized membrane protein
VVHIVSASFWLGAASTLAFFVIPALMSAEMTGMRLMKQIMIERRLRIYTLLAMLLTIGSGAYLLTNAAGMKGAPQTPAQMDYAIGAVLGVLAGLVLLFVAAPTGSKLGKLVGSLGAGAPTTEQGAEIVRLARRMIIGARSIAILTLGAASLMALARYAG